MATPLEVVPLTPPGVSPDSWRMLTQWPLVPSELQMGTTPAWRGAPGNAPEKAPGYSPGASHGVFYMGTDCGGVFQGHLSPFPLTASPSTSSSSSPNQSRLDFQFGSCLACAPATSAATSSAVSASASAYVPLTPSRSGIPAKQESECATHHQSAFISGLHCHPCASLLSSDPPLWLTFLLGNLDCHSSSATGAGQPSSSSTRSGFDNSLSSRGDAVGEWHDVVPSHRGFTTPSHDGVTMPRSSSVGMPCQGDLILSSSWDWTVKLWSSAVSHRPLLTLQSINDTCHDVRWCPSSLSTFAVSLGSRRIQLWDLASSTRCPVATMSSTVRSTVASTESNTVGKPEQCPTRPGDVCYDSEQGREENGKHSIVDDGVFIRLRWTCDGNVIIAGDTLGRVFTINV
ncbi:hypothetical protein CLOM_g3713 [Closterium sp. NIES-68]|nr:hypothetical protein CLOM_g3713 [Closterium sp. NIES-68]